MMNFNTGRIFQLVLLGGYGLFCILAIAGLSFAADTFNVQASILKYESVCDLNAPANLPKSIVFSKGSWSQGGCGGIEKSFGHPTAIKIQLENLTASEAKIPIAQNFKNVIVSQGKSKRFPVAFQLYSHGMLGYLTQTPNTLEMVVDGHKKVDLVFFFEKIAPNANIQLGDLGPVNIK